MNYMTRELESEADWQLMQLKRKHGWQFLTEALSEMDEQHIEELWRAYQGGNNVELAQAFRRAIDSYWWPMAKRLAEEQA